jgi:hypothetical protein
VPKKSGNPAAHLICRAITFGGKKLETEKRKKMTAGMYTETYSNFI